MQCSEMAFMLEEQVSEAAVLEDLTLASVLWADSQHRHFGGKVMLMQHNDDEHFQRIVQRKDRVR